MYSFQYQENMLEQFSVQAKDFPVQDSFVQSLFKKSLDNLFEEWLLVIPASNVPYCNIAAAITSHHTQGYDVSEADCLFEKASVLWEQKQYDDLKVYTAKIYQSLRNSPKDTKSLYWSYNLPTTFDEITQGMNFDSNSVSISREQWTNVTRQAWWAMFIGGAYGTPLEGWSGDKLRSTYGDKLKGYVCSGLTLYNDDITFPLCYLDMLCSDKNITADNLGKEWLRNLSFAMTAEKYALEGLHRGYTTPDTAQLYPYFGEWIGASMRVGLWGMLFPANPQGAMKAAYEDSTISHHYNGVYTAMYLAAITSLAYVYKDTKELVLQTEKYIPQDTLTHDIYKKTILAAKSSSCAISSFELLQDDIKHYHWVHTIPNFAIVILALYFSENNFEKALLICGQLGLDVDSTAVEVGAIMGIMFPDQISDEWKSPFNKNEIASFVENYYRFTIDELMDKMEKAYIFQNSQF